MAIFCRLHWWLGLPEGLDMRVNEWGVSLMTARFLANGTRKMKVSSVETHQVRQRTLEEGQGWLKGKIKREREKHKFF